MFQTLIQQPLFNVLLVLLAFIPGGDLGVAIIILTVIVRLLMWPLLKKQLNQQEAMKELQPEIKKLREKADGDKQKEAQLMAEFFKEHNVNPFSSIGLSILQAPVLIGLFFIFRDWLTVGKITDQAYGFIQSIPAIQGFLNNPESFNTMFLGLVDLTQPSIYLALAAGLAQYLQAKQITPQNMMGAKDGKKAGFNFALILPVFITVIAARFPSALALYWTANALVAAAQQYVVLGEDVSFMEKLARIKGGGSDAKAGAD